MLCCSLAFGVTGLSYFIGITIIIAGLIFAILTSVQQKGLISVNGLFASVIISFGVMFILRKLASIIVDFIPWTLITLGVAILLDILLLRFAKKDKSTLKLVLRIVIGAVITTLGFLVKFISGWDVYSSIILGIILILYALISIFYTVLKK